MTFKSRYNFGDTVYLRTDPEQSEHLITGLLFRPGGNLVIASWNGQEITGYDFEWTTERDPLKPMGLNNKNDDGDDN